jgi:hypothetical protein
MSTTRKRAGKRPVHGRGVLRKGATPAPPPGSAHDLRGGVPLVAGGGGFRLFIDPGANDFGGCLLNADGDPLVQAATLLRNAKGPQDSVLARGAGALDALLSWFQALNVRPEQIVSVLVEMPRVYPGKKTKDPNSVMLTAAMCGAFAAFGVAGREARSVYPRDWKGGMDGDTFIRTTVQPSVLPEELLRIDVSCAESYRHNVWDAVGLALWSVRRLKSPRIYHGATPG